MTTSVSLYPVDTFIHTIWLKNLIEVFETVRLKQFSIKESSLNFVTKKSIYATVSKTIYPIQALTLFGKQFRQGVMQMLDLPCSIIPYEEFNLLSISTSYNFAVSMLSKIQLPDIDASQGVVLQCNNCECYDILLTYLAIQCAKKAKWVAIATDDEFAIVIFSVNPAKPVGKLITL